MGATNFDSVDTSEGYKVNGTTVINSSGDFVGDLSGADITTTGDTTLGNGAGDTLIVNGDSSTYNTPVLVGVDDTGYDVTFFGATAGASMLWDESADTLILGGSAKLTVNDIVTASAGVLESASPRTPAADDGPNTTINAGFTAVDVAAPVNDANDWITLPALSTVPVGHTIKIACNGGSNFELRTPSASNEKINAVDADGTQEYLCTDTDLIFVSKVSDTDGWYAYDLTSAGSFRAAHTPD